MTDKATAEIAEMVLSGTINKELVGWISQAGGKAIGHLGQGWRADHRAQAAPHLARPR